MRVGYVLKRYPRYSETFIVNEILAHEAAGLEIEIFALRSPSDTHFQDSISRVRAPVTYVPSSAPKGTELWRTLCKAASEIDGFEARLADAWGAEALEVAQALFVGQKAIERGVTHLHAHFATTSTTVARLASRFFDLPYSFTAHAKDIFHEDVDADELRTKQADAAGVVTVSDFNAKFLKAHHGSAADRVHRIYNGLELDRFPYSEAYDRGPRIVAVGRLVEKKGFDDLIDACALLAERGRRFECEIIGTGDQEASLRERIQSRGLSEIVSMPGPRPQREVVEHVRAAAVFAAPCVIGRDGNRDGLPTTLLEAMALGTPCVSTDVTGIPEVIRDGLTGLVVRQRDPFELATALERLLDDGDLRTKLAAAARELVEAEFDIHRNTSRIRDLFRVAQNGGASAEVGGSTAPSD